MCSSSRGGGEEDRGVHTGRRPGAFLVAERASSVGRRLAASWRRGVRGAVAWRRTPRPQGAHLVACGAIADPDSREARCACVAQRNFSTPHAPVGIQAVINTGAREEIAGTCGHPPSSRAPVDVNDAMRAQRPTDVSATTAGAAEEATKTRKFENGVCTVHMRRDDRDKEYNALHPARLIIRLARLAGRCNGQLLKVERERIGERRRNFSVPRL